MSRLDEFTDSVARSLSSHSDAATRYLAAVPTNAALIELLNDVSMDDVALAEIASRSYTHPGGFEKLVLSADATQEFKIRLHVWRPSGVAHREDIHNHRWDFASRMLAGSYTMSQFVRDPGGFAVTELRYVPNVDGTGHSLTPVGKAELRCIFSADISAGSSYFVSSEVYHRVINGGADTTTTLIVQGSAKSPETTVFRDNQASSEYVDYVHPTSTKLRDIFLDALALIKPDQ